MGTGSSAPLWLRDLGFFALALVLIGLGTGSSTGLTGLDESIHSFRSAIETYDHGRWWTPTLEGEPRVRKPPLLYWLMGLSFSAFGVTFFSGRLPVVVMGALLVLLCRQIARQLGRDDAVLVGWLALGLFAVASESRRAMLDIPVATCTALAVLLALQAWSRQQPWRLYGAALATAAGAMFKGPVIGVFVGAAAIAARLSPPLPGPGLGWKAWIGPVALALLAASIWPLSIVLLYPEAFAVFEDELEDRQLSLPGPGSLLKVSSATLAVALPWSVALLAGALAALRSARLPRDPRLGWLLWWLLLALLPFLFIRTFERYLVPLIPVLALLVAELCREPRRWPARIGLLLAVLLLALPTLAFAALAWRFEQQLALPLLSLLALAVTAFFALRGQPLRQAQASALTLALSLGAVYPQLGISRLPAEVLPLMREQPVAHYRQPHPGVASIHLARSLPVLDGPEQLAAFDGVLIVPEAERTQLEADAERAGLKLAELARFESFHARTQFVRFARADARSEDWLAAWRDRDWQSLKPRFALIRTRPGREAGAPANPVVTLERS